MTTYCQQSQKSLKLFATNQLQDEDGLTVLHCAAGEGHGTIVSTLLASAPWLADEQTRWIFFGQWADKVVIFLIIFLADEQTRWLFLWLSFWPMSRQGDYFFGTIFGQWADKVIIFVIAFWPKSRQSYYSCIFSLCQVHVDDVDHLVQYSCRRCVLHFRTLINQ